MYRSAIFILALLLVNHASSVYSARTKRGSQSTTESSEDHFGQIKSRKDVDASPIVVFPTFPKADTVNRAEPLLREVKVLEEKAKELQSQLDSLHQSLEKVESDLNLAVQQQEFEKAQTAKEMITDTKKKVKELEQHIEDNKQNIASKEVEAVSEVKKSVMANAQDLLQGAAGAQGTSKTARDHFRSQVDKLVLKHGHLLVEALAFFNSVLRKVDNAGTGIKTCDIFFGLSDVDYIRCGRIDTATGYLDRNYILRGETQKSLTIDRAGIQEMQFGNSFLGLVHPWLDGRLFHVFVTFLKQRRFNIQSHYSHDYLRYLSVHGFDESVGGFYSHHGWRLNINLWEHEERDVDYTDWLSERIGFNTTTTTFGDRAGLLSSHCSFYSIGTAVKVETDFGGTITPPLPYYETSELQLWRKIATLTAKDLLAIDRHVAFTFRNVCMGKTTPSPEGQFAVVLSSCKYVNKIIEWLEKHP